MSARPRLLLIDNYDSFTYNLVQAFLMLGAEVDVHRNDVISVEEALALEPTHLVISPGPALRAMPGVDAHDRGLCRADSDPGVCLGTVAVEVFGGRVVRAGRLMHGKTSPVAHDAKGVFAAWRRTSRRDAITP